MIYALSLRESVLYYKITLKDIFFSKEKFIEFCGILKKIPLNSAHPEFCGLYLEGDRFDKKILLNEIENVDIEDIEKIKIIAPVLSQSEDKIMPFKIVDNCIRIILHPDSDDHEKLKNYIDSLANFADKFGANLQSQNVEIHFKSNFDNKIFIETIPDLKKGDYNYLIKIAENKETGEIKCPVEYEKLPDIFRQLNNIFQENWFVKLRTDKNNKCLKFEAVKKTEMETSIYSDSNQWFFSVLDIFNAHNLFEKSEYKPERIPKL